MNTTVVEGYQLSPQQKRLWLLKQQFQDMPGRVRCNVLLKGDVDIACLRAAFQATIDRHEILRTLFQTIAGMDVPLQVIGTTATAWLADGDLPSLEEHCSPQDFESMLPEIMQQNPEQDSNSPATAKLYTLGQVTHVLLLDMPALWLDQQGLECFVSDLMHSYQADETSETEEPVQYAAVAQWLNELLDGQESAEGQTYWQERLAATQTPVPFARAAGADRHFQPQRLRTIVAPAIVDKIDALSGASPVAWQAFLLTSFSLLLWKLGRMTADEDIIIGSAIDGRTEPELHAVPGLLTRYLPLLAHLESQDTYAEVWTRMTRAIQEAEAWQDCFDWGAASQTGEQDATADYFPICFDFQYEQQEQRAGDITATIIDSLVYSDLFDVRLSCIRTKRGLVTDLYYNSELLSGSDVERLALYFTNLITEAVANPDMNIAALEILGEAERSILLNDLARGKQTVLVDGCLSTAFEEQVKHTPHNIALICEGRTLTYAELNSRANKLAHLLQQSGVKPDMMVAYCTERSVETIVSLLGILKAGGVCVPLDPAYPQERLAFILQDSQSTVIVTHEKLAQLFNEYELEVVSLETLDSLDGATEDLACKIGPENLAYVIYTSGSTGLPKGVAVTHHAALNHLIAMQSEFHLSDADRILQFASLSFDVSLEQIFPGLLCGATVVMRGPTSWSVEELNRAIVEQGLTVVNLTPAFWQQWTHELQQAADVLHATQLKLVIVGGEAMTLEALRSWRETPLAQLRLLNAYGPTETIITTSFYEVSSHLTKENGIKTVPIGRPLANREIYILDSAGNPTPRGVAGELYIGGALLARGYLNRPELTEERFVPHPFSSTPGARLYRSGDLGRYLSDGNIEYLGRIDQQVKIRGFRIELEEIEAVLLQHSAVRAAVVVAREDEPGEKRLVAYILLQEQRRVSVADLRTFLEEVLPMYMIPSTLMVLDALPLTTHGKVDRRALPAPDTSRPELEETFVAPRTSMEETLASIWRETLGLNQVGIHDNFFKLGGHSLVAIQVITRIRTTFQVELPVHVLFQEPTLARLADKIIEAQNAKDSPVVPAITRQSRDSGTIYCAQPVSKS